MFLNHKQEIANNTIGMFIFYADLAVLIGIPLYTFLQGYGIGSTIIMIFVTLFIISPITSRLFAIIPAIVMTIWTRNN